MKYTPLIAAQASGSVGGNTFSRNRGGIYIRRRATPVNSNTVQQQAVRSSFANAQAAWNNVLTSLQRSAWDTYASNTPLTDALGQQVNAGGKGMFTRGYVPRIQAGLTIVAAGPSSYGLPSMTLPGITSLTATTRVAIVTFTNTDPWAIAVGGALLMFTSRPQNASINYFKGPYQFAGRILGAGTPPTTPQNITTPFAVAAGQKVFVRFVSVTPDGRLSPEARFSVNAI